MTDFVQDWILQYNSGRAWFNKLNSFNTKRTYLPNFKKYCEWAKKDPDQLIELKIEGLQSINTPKEFQAENLLETFLSTSKDTASIKDMVRTVVLSFYKNNRRPLVEIAEVFTPESKRRCPKMQDILDLENAFGFCRDKALLWFLACAPFRVDSLTKLRWSDLKATSDKDIPYYLIVESDRLKGCGKGKYKGVKQIAFLHSLAASKLENYKKELRQKGYIHKEDDPIFVAYRKEKKITPLVTFTVEDNFGKASLRAWHDLDKKRFSPQDFRSFVQGALENAGVNANMISPLLGHKVKGVDFHYSEHDILDLLQKYKLALPWLLPQSVEQVKAESDKALAEEHAELEKLQAKYERSEEKLSFLDSFIRLNDVIETKSDAQRLLDFMEKLRKEKLAKAYQEEEEEKAEIADKLGRSI